MKQLLLVDDEVEVTNALRREITLAYKAPDFEIFTFTNPVNALAHIDEYGEWVFLVISDLRMNEMQGNEFLKAMRKKHTSINSVLLTAFSELDNIQKAVQTSLQNFIIKPWTTESLLNEIEKASKTWELYRENSNLKQRISQLLADAGDFQRRVFAQSTPKFNSGTLSLCYEPMDEYCCGGDFFEITPVHNGYSVLLGDVSGHGPKSAIASGMVKSILHMLRSSQAWKFTAPNLLLEALNEELCALFNGTPDVLVTMMAIYINSQTSELLICNAGQPMAIMHNNSVLQEIGTVQPPLSVRSGQIYKKTSFNFSESTRLYLFTDGLHESTLQKNGAESIQQIITDQISVEINGNNLNFGTAAELVDRIKQRAGLDKLGDDLSFISLSPADMVSE